MNKSTSIPLILQGMGEAKKAPAVIGWFEFQFGVSREPNEEELFKVEYTHEPDTLDISKDFNQLHPTINRKGRRVEEVVIGFRSPINPTAVLSYLNQIVSRMVDWGWLWRQNKQFDDKAKS